jgi:hypothetical protein
VSFALYSVGMRIEMIYCPACRHKLRIPEDLMGQPVLCPSCQTEFIAPPPPIGGDRPIEAIREGRASARNSGGSEDFREDAYRDDDIRRRDKPNPFVSVAATLLIGVSLLGLADGAFRLITYSPQKLVATMKQMQTAFPTLPAMDQESFKMGYLAGAVIFGFFSLISLLGGLAMLRRRFFPIAVFGSILAILNISDCCCLLGAPVGIACLFILFQPTVRASFHSHTGS